MGIRVHLDYETSSEADIKKVGHIAYAKHPSTRILMASWKIKDAPVKQWHYLQGEAPDELIDILENRDARYRVWAHNASFEIAITRYVATRQLGVYVPENWWPWLTNWRCSMVQGMAMSLPGTLREQGQILGSNIKKQEDGMRLIRTFCVPRKPTKNNPAKWWHPSDKPADWEQFLSYNRDDVDAEHANWRRTGGFPVPDHEWYLWHIDQDINFRGLRIDTELVHAALAVNEIVQLKLKDEMKKLTGLANPNSPSQLLAWLNDRGYPHDNLRKANVEKELKAYLSYATTFEGPEPDFDGDVARALDLRLLTSRTSIKKFDALKNSVELEPYMYGVFQFAGAGRTWRWAGRRFQPQNLPRGIFKNEGEMKTAIAAVKRIDVDFLDLMYDLENIPDVLSSLIRNCVVASPGKVLTVADLASIESVMLAWAANSEYMLDLFREGRDIYKDFATHWLKVPYDQVTKPMRQLCKPPSLGCGYLLGAKGLLLYAEAMGVKLSKEEAKTAVKTYRTAYPDVPKFWNDLDEAARVCISTGREVVVNGKFRFRMQKPCMMIDLPSGRSLCYIRPQLEERLFRFEDIDTGEIKERWQVSVCYEGKNQTNNRWERIATHAGKITENIVQAIARDILAEGILNVHTEMPEAAMVLHVHDELGAETDPDPIHLARLQELMTMPPAWGRDIPLNSAGFQSVFYMKD